MIEFAVTFREMLEASLIVGIIVTILQNQGHTKYMKAIVGGIIVAIGVSIAFGFLLQYVNSLVETTAYEKLFESLMMYIAAFFLISMIVRMTHHKGVKQELQEKTLHAMGKGASWGLFWMVVFVIAREGFETVLFLFGASNVSGEASFSHLGFWLGIISAGFIGLCTFLRGKRVPIKRFFHVTSLLLVFFAAGMVAYGTHELEEFLTKQGYWNESSITRVWNILRPVSELSSASPAWMYSYNESKDVYYHIFHDKGVIGGYMKGFFGYNSDPNRYELFAWIVTLSLGLYLVTGWQPGGRHQDV